MELKSCIVRSYRLLDAESLAFYANNKKIWLNLRDIFSHPYKIENVTTQLPWKGGVQKMVKPFFEHPHHPWAE